MGTLYRSADALKEAAKRECEGGPLSPAYDGTYHGVAMYRGVEDIALAKAQIIIPIRRIPPVSDVSVHGTD
jgi:hypothetical protein